MSRRSASVVSRSAEASATTRTGRGLTCDHLLSRPGSSPPAGGWCEAEREHHPDLFWACRGGAGGSFGINTQFTFQLPEIPAREVAFYRFDWRGADAAARSCAHLTSFSTRMPGDSTLSPWPRRHPLGPDGPREAIAVFSRGQYIGPSPSSRRYVQPLIDAAGLPAKRTLTTLKYWDMQRMFASSEGTRHAFGDVSRYRQGATARRHLREDRRPAGGMSQSDPGVNGSMWSLGWIGGPAVRRFDRRADRLRPSRHADAAARHSGVGKSTPPSRCRTS